MAKIFNTDGTTRDIEPKNGTNFQLDEMKEIVGGYIELVYLRDGRLLVINEEGKLYKLDVNLAATTMAHAARAIADWDCIVGNVLLCNSDQIK